MATSKANNKTKTQNGNNKCKSNLSNFANQSVETNLKTKKKHAERNEGNFFKKRKKQTKKFLG